MPLVMSKPIVPTAESALDKVPPLQQALYVLKRFESARTREDYLLVSRWWTKVRPRLEHTVDALDCKTSGAASDLDIAKGVIDDLSTAPLALIMSLSEFVLAFAARDSDALLDALRDALKHLADEAVGVMEDKAFGAASRSLDKALVVLKSALIKYLQSVSKRNRRHVEKIFDSATGVLRGLGGTVAFTTRIIFKPTRISADECTVLKQVEQAEREAFSRLFPAKLPQSRLHY